MVRARSPLFAAGLAFAFVISGALAQAQPTPQSLPNMGQQITPLAPPDSRFETLNPDLADMPNWLAGQAVTSVVSPDRKTLLVLTSGYNRVYTTTPSLPYPWNAPDSQEYVFVYDISMPTPVKKQVVKIPNTYSGIAFDPSGKAFYVAGGPSDNLHIIAWNAAGMWAETADSPIALNHRDAKSGQLQGVGLAIASNGATAINNRVGVSPCAAGVAISSDGQTLVVVNYYNDSITVFNGGFGNWSITSPNFDLRPGKNDPALAGAPGGEYPFWAAVKGNGPDATAYVSSIRDREIVVVSLGPKPAVTTRIRVKGQPNKMTLNAAQSLLYVVEDQSDTVDVISTSYNQILETIPVIAPASILPTSLWKYTGANPNSVTLSPDEKQLYVTNGNLNSIAVVDLTGNLTGDRVVGLIPTGWYPNSVSFSGDGRTVYVVNGKSPTGADPGFCYGGYGPAGSPNCNLSNQYTPQRIKAGFQSFPRPNTAQLIALTQQVAANNRFSSSVSDNDAALLAAVRQGVQHVIFIIKENRTYDQVLGDLEVGNGDPSLTLFGESVTPNQHKLARTFVTLDNFMDTAEVSFDGWLWTTAARAPDVVERQFPVAYALRGLSLDSEGTSRSVNVSLPTLAQRKAANPFTSDDPDVLPGQTNVDAPDGPNNEVNTGYLWDAALRAGLTVRNYGFFVDTTRYNTVAYAIPVLRDPAATGTVVSYPSSASLAPYTDPYFRGFDNTLPDYYRFKEWEREFDALVARRRASPAGSAAPTLPSLSLVRFMHDHTGNWTSPPMDRVDTPELQVADNDYAVGLLVEKISKSEFASNTLIFVIEDDAQDGGDHVDSHRSIAFVAGAWVRQGAVVSTQYNTINFIRTMEEVLGLPPMNLNDALARPMADIFSSTPNPWKFQAAPAPMLVEQTDLFPATPKLGGALSQKPAHDVNYWARVTKGMDFSTEDRVDPEAFNRILWKGLAGDKPYPAAPTGLDLRQNRRKFLARYRQSLKDKAAVDPAVSRIAAK